MPPPRSPACCNVCFLSGPEGYSMCAEACRRFSVAQHYDAECLSLYDQLAKRFPNDPEYTTSRLGSSKAAVATQSLGTNHAHLWTQSC